MSGRDASTVEEEALLRRLYPPRDADSVPSLHWLRGLFRAQLALDPTEEELIDQRTAAENIMRRRIAVESPRDQDLYLDQVRDGYAEQDRRSERTERRATPLLGGISIISAAVAATSGILSGSEALTNDVPRVLAGFAILLVLVCFGAAARWALSVLTVQDTPRRPSTATMLKARAERTDRELYVHSVGALIDSIEWNQRIANYKARRLRNASWWFGIGLVLLLVTVAGFVVLTTVSPAVDTATQAGPRGLRGPRGPPGPVVRTVTRRVQVRAVVATREMLALSGRRLHVRYAITHPSAVTVSIERDGRKVGPTVSETAGFGPNTTSISAPAAGRYLLRIDVRAANGTTTSAEAPLIVR